jgi:hypothetical protein
MSSNWTITTFRIIYYMNNEETGPFIIAAPNYQRCLDFENLKKINKKNIEKLYLNIEILDMEYKIYSYEILFEIKFKWFTQPNTQENINISKLLHSYFTNNNDNKNLIFQNKRLYIHKQTYIDLYGKEI